MELAQKPTYSEGTPPWIQWGYDYTGDVDWEKLRVCVHVCMYIYIYVYVNIYTYIHIHTYVYIYIYIHVQIFDVIQGFIMVTYQPQSGYIGIHWDTMGCILEYHRI